VLYAVSRERHPSPPPPQTGEVSPRADALSPKGRGERHWPLRASVNHISSPLAGEDKGEGESANRYYVRENGSDGKAVKLGALEQHPQHHTATLE
jgi:hypothetical protein